MPNFTSTYLEALTAQIFEAMAVPPADAVLVAKELVEANLMGLDSHGVIRIPQYANYINRKRILPGAPVTRHKETSTTVIIDGGNNFGQVVGFQALQVAMDKAKAHQISCVLAHRCNHVGRLGAYPQRAAEQGMLCVATANWPIEGHHVAPFGGREGRLSTNPIAYGVPTEGHPIVADFATSVMAEGKVRVLRNKGQALPDQAVINAKGQITQDPNEFYGPPSGAILPFGGAVGYKGYALSLLVEILGGPLLGRLTNDTNQHGNGLCLIVINPEAFIAFAEFEGLMAHLSDYVTASPLAEGSDEVVLPGEREFRTREKRQAEGISLDNETWAQIQQVAQTLNVAVS